MATKDATWPIPRFSREDAKLLDQFEKNQLFMAQTWEALMTSYPNEYVAAYQCRIAAHSNDLSALHEALDALGVPRDGRAVTFVSTRDLEDLL